MSLGIAAGECPLTDNERLAIYLQRTPVVQQGVERSVDSNKTTDLLEIRIQDSSAHLVRPSMTATARFVICGSPGGPDHDVAMCRISDLTRRPGRLISPMALVGGG